MQYPRSTRSRFKRPFLPEPWTNWSRFWVLLCVLPMLFMSVLSDAPHNHELRALTSLTAHHHHSTSTQHASSASAKSASQPTAEMSVSALHIEGAVAADCLLCHWAGVALACLAVALTLLWLQLGLLPVAPSPSLVYCCVPRSLRSRAPPLA